MIDNEPGEALASILRVMSACRTRLPKRTSARLIADAAASLHTRPVRGSVSPQTIIVTISGSVEVVDSASACHPRGDVYALGAVLYELVCGEPPKDPLVSFAEHLAAQTRMQALTRRPPDIDADIERIVTKAMAAEDGYGSADALRRDLESYLAALGDAPSRADLAKLLVNTFGARYVAKLAPRPAVAVATPAPAPSPVITATPVLVEAAPEPPQTPAPAPRSRHRSLYAAAVSAATALAFFFRWVR